MAPTLQKRCAIDPRQLRNPEWRHTGIIAKENMLDEDRGFTFRDAIRAWARGIILQFSNPKALLFFTALLPQFIHANTPLAPQIETLGVTTIIVGFTVLSIYGALAGSLSQTVRHPQFVKTTNRVSGVLLAGAGAGIALAGER